MAQHLLASLVLEADILKFHVPANLRPVFPLGFKAGAIALDHLRAVGDLRLGIDQRHDALGRCLGGLQIRENTGKVQHWLEEIAR